MDVAQVLIWILPWNTDSAARIDRRPPFVIRHDIAGDDADPIGSPQ
jgi:hypothetical protein